MVLSNGLIVEHRLEVESRRAVHILSCKGWLLHEVLGLDLRLDMWLWLRRAINIHLCRRYLMETKPLLTHWVASMTCSKEGV